MATGISFPVRANNKGGLRLSSGDEQDWNIIALALLSDHNENAFAQNLGLGTPGVFDVADPGMRALVLGRLRDVFRRFEALKRFKLREDTIRWTESGNGITELSFKYVALEADEEREFLKKFNSPQAGAGGDVTSNNR